MGSARSRSAGHRRSSAVSACGSVRNSHSHSQALQIVRLLPVRMFLLALLLVGLVFGTLWIGGDRLVSRFEPGSMERDPAAVSRKEIWQATWQMSKAHPIVGVGLGGYWIAILIS